jgi:hypothetical protein
MERIPPYSEHLGYPKSEWIDVSDYGPPRGVIGSLAKFSECDKPKRISEINLMDDGDVIYHHTEGRMEDWLSDRIDDIKFL